MPELTDINGVGPTTAENLRDEGIETVEDVASKTSGELSDDVDHLTDNSASKIVLSAQELNEDNEEPSEEEVLGEEFSDYEERSESATESDELLEDAEDSEEDETSEEAAEEPESFAVDLDTDPYQEQLVITALVTRYESQRRSNTARADALKEMLSQAEDGLSFELSSLELNTLFAAVRQRKTHYQGKNMIDEMNLLRDVQDQVQEYRDEYIF